jgi:hypothetical protein
VESHPLFSADGAECACEETPNTRERTMRKNGAISTSPSVKGWCSSKIEYLPSKNEALNSNPSTKGKKVQKACHL